LRPRRMFSPFSRNVPDQHDHKAVCEAAGGDLHLFPPQPSSFCRSFLPAWLVLLFSLIARPARLGQQKGTRSKRGPSVPVSETTLATSFLSPTGAA